MMFKLVLKPLQTRIKTFH